MLVCPSLANSDKWLTGDTECWLRSSANKTYTSRSYHQPKAHTGHVLPGAITPELFVAGETDDKLSYPAAALGAH